MKPFSLALWLVALSVCWSPGRLAAAQAGWNSVGLRGGLSAMATESYFHQLEGFAVYQLPWELRARSGFGAATQFGVTAGVLKGNGDYSFIGSAGPGFTLGKTGFPLELDLGVSVTFLSYDTFGRRDYNGQVQFSSHGGVNYRLTKRIGLGYRIQHMSNAGMNGCRNPGLNLHLFGVNWYFDP